jgi:hypothetical protein
MANICEKNDCRYFSLYTATCDYTLINYKKRPCAVEGCTEYARRDELRTWMKYWPVQNGNGAGNGEVKRVEIPERAIEPPEARFVTADCGHEVYLGETLYEWSGGETLCPDCVEDRFAELSTDEKAALLGCAGATVKDAR